MSTLFAYVYYRYQWSPLQSWLSFEAVLMKALLLLSMVDAMAVVKFLLLPTALTYIQADFSSHQNLKDLSLSI
jgi:hypothetical protein